MTYDSPANEEGKDFSIRSRKFLKVPFLWTSSNKNIAPTSATPLQIKYTDSGERDFDNFFQFRIGFINNSTTTPSNLNSSFRAQTHRRCIHPLQYPCPTPCRALPPRSRTYDIDSARFISFKSAKSRERFLQTKRSPCAHPSTCPNSARARFSATSLCSASASPIFRSA